METSAFPGSGQIRKSLLRRLFSGFYMLRWNDKLRPCPLAEIDKQAHKMIVACLLWTRSCRTDPSRGLLLAGEIIEGALFDYLFRLVITDIKPPIFYRIQENPERRAKLLHYVLESLAPVLAPLADFGRRFEHWHVHRDSFPEARRLLQAAHLFASQWEFSLIRPLNGFDAELPAIAENFDRQLQALQDVPGLKEILDPGTALSAFASFCGQLRFQVRWTQIPRIPQTDVLGHMFFTAALAYLYSLTIGACPARCVNNFFCGLFHDLPELLTRDIISPVKRSSSDLDGFIRQYEKEELNRRVLDPLISAGETDFVDRLRYYLGLDLDSEFSERWLEDGRMRAEESLEKLHSLHNRDGESPLDGQLVKTCDNLAAFLEADESIRSGVSSGYLVDARRRIRETLCDRAHTPACLQTDSLLADFD